MHTQGIISHRMFVAALSHDEKAAVKVPPPGGKPGAKDKNRGRKVRRAELTPHQLMLSIINEGFQPYEA